MQIDRAENSRADYRHALPAASRGTVRRALVIGFALLVLSTITPQGALAGTSLTGTTLEASEAQVYARASVWM